MKNFSRYKNLKLTPNTSHIRINFQDLSFVESQRIINQANSINHRNQLICLVLKSLHTEILIDLGCDFGSLLATANDFGISGIGLDIDERAVTEVLESGQFAIVGDFQNLTDDTFFQDLIKKSRNYEPRKRVALSILNVIHSDDFDVQFRNNLLHSIKDKVTSLVLTCTKSQLKQIRSILPEFSDIQFIGHRQGPISRSRSQLLQYGRLFIFRNRLSILEDYFWSWNPSKFLYPNTFDSYSRLVVVLSKS